jgi:hypothetical protein
MVTKIEEMGKSENGYDPQAYLYILEAAITQYECGFEYTVDLSKAINSVSEGPVPREASERYLGVVRRLLEVGLIDEAEQVISKIETVDRRMQAYIDVARKRHSLGLDGTFLIEKAEALIPNSSLDEHRQLTHCLSFARIRKEFGIDTSPAFFAAVRKAGAAPDRFQRCFSYMEIARVQHELGEEPTALRPAEQYAGFMPTSIEKDKVLGALAESCIELGKDPGNAIAMLKADTTWTADPTYVLDRSKKIFNLEIKAGLVESAQDTWQKGNLEDSGLSINAGMAKAFIVKHLWQEAESNIEKVQSHFERSKLYSSLAIAQAKAGKFQEAKNIADSKIQFEGKEEAYMALATAYAEKAMWDKALEVSSVIEVQFNKIKEYCILARIAHTQNARVTEDSYIQHALYLAMKTSESRVLEVGQCALDLNNFDAAYDLLLKINQVEFAVEFGFKLMEKEKETLGRIIHTNPGGLAGKIARIFTVNTENLLKLVRLQIEAGDLRGASHTYTLVPEGEGQLELAHIYALAGNTSKVIEILLAQPEKSIMAANIYGSVAKNLAKNGLAKHEVNGIVPTAWRMVVGNNNLGGLPFSERHAGFIAEQTLPMVLEKMPKFA